jgi:signal transduction histidine kinase/ActR/RegA family two-component response regulator
MSTPPEHPPAVPATTTADMEILLRRVERERRARKQAEQLLENRSMELYEANQRLQAHAAELERIVHERTRALEQALAVVEESLRAKNDFVAVVSHEIRTPMNGVLGMVQLLLMTELTDEQKGYCETIRSSGEILLALINDILDLSKMESGKVSLDARPVDIRSVVNEVMQLMSGQAQPKKLSLRSDIAADIPAWFRGDGIHLKQIFLNLVGNAIKFTHRGGVRVEVAAVENGTWLECRVKDTGIGIPPDRVGRLFEKFSQVDSSITRRYGGTGLGLAICKRLVEGMGGSIGVESKHYQGSTFTFRIPAIPSDAPREVKPRPQAEPQRVAQMRILLVEDNPVNQMLAMSMLQKLGASPDLAKDGEEAAEKTRIGDYDLVLMDMQMPRMDGLSATRVIRAMPDIRQLRIVALTANAMESDRQACLDAGMDDFLSKPFQVTDLQDKLDAVALSVQPADV